MTAILALDQGTTGSTALVISREGRVLGRGYREVPQHFPKPGWVEHEPDDLVRSTVDAARDALREAGVTPLGVGITNQRETTVAWERETTRPVGRAIVWQDRRTADICRALEPHATFIRERTGLVLDPYFSGTKVQWRLQHDDDLAKRVASGDVVFGTVDSWLLARLTGGRVFATDHTNASRTMLYGLDAGAWDDELLELFGVPRHALPEIRNSSADYGTTEPDVLGVELPIGGVVGDQQGALFGQGCWEAGQGKNTYGTGAFLLLNTGDTRPRSDGGLLETRASGPRGEPVYALEGSVFIAGAAVQWLRDGLQLLERASDTEAMARSVSDTGGVYFVPAFVGLGAPHWESEARGTIVGLTRGTTREHLARAALEAMAYSTKDVVDTMLRDTGLSLEAMQVDGGASTNDWLMQFQADVLGVTVARPDLVETTALGAAGLAGLHVGLWQAPQDFLNVRSFTEFQPNPNRDDVDYEGWTRAVQATLAWARNRA